MRGESRFFFVMCFIAVATIALIVFAPAYPSYETAVDSSAAAEQGDERLAFHPLSRVLNEGFDARSNDAQGRTVRSRRSPWVLLAYAVVFLCILTGMRVLVRRRLRAAQVDTGGE